MVRVKTRAGFAAPTWSCERGDEIEVPLADARRMVCRGLAESSDERVKKMSREEREEAERNEHASKLTEVLRTRLGLQEIEAPTGRKHLKD
jgi:hypothetical protein